MAKKINKIAIDAHLTPLSCLLRFMKYSYFRVVKKKTKLTLLLWSKKKMLCIMYICLERWRWKYAHTMLRAIHKFALLAKREMCMNWTFAVFFLFDMRSPRITRTTFVLCRAGCDWELRWNASFIISFKLRDSLIYMAIQLQSEVGATEYVRSFVNYTEFPKRTHLLFWSLSRATAYCCFYGSSLL